VTRLPDLGIGLGFVIQIEKSQCCYFLVHWRVSLLRFHHSSVHRGKHNLWYLVERKPPLSEIDMLLLFVQSAKFHARSGKRLVQLLDVT